MVCLLDPAWAASYILGTNSAELLERLNCFRREQGIFTSQIAVRRNRKAGKKQ